jgi:hypothetical protein
LIQGSKSAPLGLKYVSLGRLGYYAGFRMGYLPPAYRYSVSNTGTIAYSESGVYQIGSETKLASYAATGGLTAQIHKKVYAYAGLGYGVEQLFWKYQAFNLDYKLVSNEWALNEQINHKGLAGEFGITARFGKILIETGMCAIGGRSSTIQITAGIGYVLSTNTKSR